MRIQLATFWPRVTLGRGAGTGPGGAGRWPAQGAQAAPVAAAAQLGVQLFGAADPSSHRCRSQFLVRVEQARPGQAGRRRSAHQRWRRWRSGGLSCARALRVRLISVMVCPRGQRGVDLGVPGLGSVRPGSPRGWRGSAAAGGPVSWSGGGSCRQERCRATARSTASARLCHRCHRSATWIASGAPAAAAFGVAARCGSRQHDLHTRMRSRATRGRIPRTAPAACRPAWPRLDALPGWCCRSWPLRSAKSSTPSTSGVLILRVGGRADQPAAAAERLTAQYSLAGLAGNSARPPRASATACSAPAACRAWSAARSGWSGPAPARRRSSLPHPGAAAEGGGPSQVTTSTSCAAAGGIGQPPLVAAVHQRQHHPAPRAGRHAACCRSGPAHAPTCPPRTRARQPARPGEEPGQ